MNSESSPNDKPPKVQSKKWLRYGLEALLVICIIFGVRAWQQRDIAQGSAPQLIGAMLDGKPYVLADKLAQPVLVHFWATWCPVCRAEQDGIASIAQDNPGNVITVAMQSGDREVVGQYMRDQGVNFPVVVDADSRIASLWGVHAVPASFVIDTEGKIRNVEIGYTTAWGLRFRLWLAGLS